MALNKRQQKILELLREQKKGSVTTLAETFEVTTASIRLDLTALEESGHVHRYHGGAKIVGSTSYELRIKHNHQNKKKIARKALEYIKPGETLFLDTGTTVLMLAKELSEIDGLTVVTNSFPVVAHLGGETDKNILFVGGEYSHAEQCCVGLMTEKNLQDVFVSKTFMGTDSIDIDNGILSSNISRLAYIQQVIGNSRQTILLVDSSKFEHVGVLKIADLTAVDMIITDDGLAQDTLNKLRAKGIRVEIA